MRLWIVGKWRHEGEAWEFFGVFSSEEKALAACTSRDMFIGPAELDVALAEAPEPWPGCYYPIPLAEGKSA